MADTEITVIPAPGVGTTQLTQTSAVGGADDNQFANPVGKTLFFIHSSGVGTPATIVRSVACSHGRSLDITFSMVAGQINVIGPLPPALFNSTVNGFVEINVDSEINIEMWAISLP